MMAWDRECGYYREKDEQAKRQQVKMVPSSHQEDTYGPCTHKQEASSHGCMAVLVMRKIAREKRAPRSTETRHLGGSLLSPGYY